jgi:LytS/YehU family sensor histidine kinase
MLFNTLASLRVLIASEPPRAEVILDRLIAFLRATLNARRGGRHTLQTS